MRAQTHTPTHAAIQDSCIYMHTYLCKCIFVIGYLLIITSIVWQDSSDELSRLVGRAAVDVDGPQTERLVSFGL